jgi:hypothetical protein
VGNPSRRDEIPLHPHVTLQKFDKCAIDFVGPINPEKMRLRASYIIIAMDYLTRWEEPTPIISCIAETATRNFFKNVAHNLDARAYYSVIKEHIFE